MKHEILRKLQRTADGEAFYVYECKTHGTLGFSQSLLSCIASDPAPKIELSEEKTCENCAFVREDPQFPQSYVICSRFGWSISIDLAKQRQLCSNGWKPKRG